METTVSALVRTLRDEIRNGVLLPEEPLNAVQLATRFGVSRVPIREALRQLEAEGLVSQAPHKRARVASLLDAQTVRESLEIREVIEPVLMRHVVRRVSNDVLERAGAALKRLNAETDIAKLRGAHGDFHALLYACADRPQMALIISGHRFRFVTEPREEALRLRAYIHTTRKVHAALLRACYARDLRSVQKCVREEASILRKALVGEDTT